MTYANRLGLDGKALAEMALPLRRQTRPVRWISRHWRGLVAAAGTLVVAMLFPIAAVIVAPYNNFTEGLTDYLNKVAPGVFLDSGPHRVALLGFAGGVVGGNNILAAKVEEEGFGILSIPGSTVTEIPGHGTGEVGEAVALGGPDLTRRTVAHLTDTDVRYYILIDAQGVKNVVDSSGGARVNVQRLVSGRAAPGDAPITLKRGTQTLDGDEALVYLQGQDLPDNVQRSERQRDFLYAMFRQALAPRTLVSNPTTLTTVLANTETNLNASEALQLAIQLKALEDAGTSVQAGVVPGRETETKAGLVPDEKRLQSVLEETVR